MSFDDCGHRHSIFVAARIIICIQQSFLVVTPYAYKFRLAGWVFVHAGRVSAMGSVFLCFIAYFFRVAHVHKF
jgi:hypothetical protein